jgi:C4-dicarboxylate-specific signal transduction histidine kinase
MKKSRLRKAFDLVMMNKWVTLSGLLVAAILVLGAYAVNADIQARVLADAQHARGARAQSLANALDRMLRWRMTETFTFAALPSIRGFSASSESDRPTRAAVALSELNSIVAADTAVRAACLVDPKGQVTLATDDSMKANWGDRVFVREALAGHLYASVPARDDGEISQYYSSPVLDNSGSVAGALVVRVDGQEMQSVLGDDSNVLVLDENGVRIVDRSEVPQPFVALVPLPPQVETDLLNEKRYGTELPLIRATNLIVLADAIRRTAATSLDYRDSRNHLIHVAIQPLASARWTVVVYDDEASLSSAAWGSLLDAIRLGIVALGVGTAGSVVMMRLKEKKP